MSGRKREPLPITVIHITAPPPRPPEHVHRWAWAQLAKGGTRQVCHGCGAER